jgi:hypothetical protein
MATSNDQTLALKDAKNPQEVWGSIKEILASLTNLDVKTVVMEYTGSDHGEAKEVEIYTCIGLLQADRTDKIHESFLKDPALAPLRDFHAEQVKLAEQEIQKRFEFVQNLGIAIMNAMNNTK